jgi:hypothetical protein
MQSDRIFQERQCSKRAVFANDDDDNDDDDDFYFTFSFIHTTM